MDWFSVSFVSGYAHVFVLLSVVLVRFPLINLCMTTTMTMLIRGGLGRLAARHVPIGPVGPPGRRPPRQIFKEGVERRRGPGAFIEDGRALRG